MHINFYVVVDLVLVLLVGWSLTSLFSTNMAISETKFWSYDAIVVSPVVGTKNEPLDPSPFFGWLLNKKAARVEVNISLAFLHWVRITFHP